MIQVNGYLYETHCHTCETSFCGRIPAAEVVDRYVSNGYTGIVITDHLHPEYLSKINSEHDWNQAMDKYLAGYQAAKKHGDEVGLQVILGLELRFPQNNNDYLVYGVDEAWLRSHPFICCTSAQEFYDTYHNEVLIIHAHPFRDGNETVYETAIHGTEVVNANPRHENGNEKAIDMFHRHPEWYPSAGSDTHRIGDEGQAGIIFPEIVHDSFEYKKMIESRNYQLWSPKNSDLIEKAVK